MTTEEEKAKLEIEVLKEKKSFYSNAAWFMFIMWLIASTTFSKP